MNYSNQHQRLSNYRSNAMARNNMGRLSTVAGSNPYRAYHQADTKNKGARVSMVSTSISALAGLFQSFGRGWQFVQKKLTVQA